MTPDLSQLRDIHLPAPVSWWPPAPGWWILAALALAGVTVAWLLVRYRRRNRWRREALAELERLRGVTPKEQLSGLSVLLRRVAVHCHSHQAAALTGEAWLAFLDRAFDRETPFQSGAGRALMEGPYARNIAADPEALMVLCERWIKRLPVKGAR